MVFSTTCEHSLRALTHLAAYGADHPCPVSDIAEAEGLPEHFLPKTLRRLSDLGFVVAVRGPGGGYRLARPPTEIWVAEVVEALDGPDSILRRCALGYQECGDETDCPMHHACKNPKRTFIGHLTRLTLDRMAKALLRKRAS